MDDKIYALMAQAEDLQTHAQALQKKAEVSFNKLSSAVAQASKEIQNRSIIHGLLVLTFGFLVTFGIYLGIYWTTANMRIERSELTITINDLENTIVELSKTAQKLRTKTWGLELVEYSDSDSLGIVLPKGKKFERNATLKNGKVVLIIN